MQTLCGLLKRHLAGCRCFFLSVSHSVPTCLRQHVFANNRNSSTAHSGMRCRLDPTCVCRAGMQSNGCVGLGLSPLRRNAEDFYCNCLGPFAVEAPTFQSARQTITVRLAGFGQRLAVSWRHRLYDNSSGYPVRIMAPCFCLVSSRDRESGGVRTWRAAQQTVLGDQPQISVLTIRVSPLCILLLKCCLRW